MKPGGGARVEDRRRPRPETSSPHVAAAARHLAERAGESLLGVIFFGSRRTSAARADAHSAYDLFVVVEGYRAFYRSLQGAGLVSRPPALLSAASRLLPPSQVSLRLETGPGSRLHAKCAVIDARSFVRETSGRRHDHFCLGRLFQPAELVYARDPEAAALLYGGLERALEETYRWGRPWLPPVFDAASYGRVLLEVSLAQEIRPEPAGRAAALCAAQRAEMEPVYERLLADLESAGELRRVPGGLALARPVGAGETLGLRLYFARSLVRATLRWAKHMVTFEGWLDYIVRKARRHGGGEIELSPRERRLPLVFLWPRLIRYLRHKDR